eukprot:6481597-Amphidinium_carterae.4
MLCIAVVVAVNDSNCRKVIPERNTVNASRLKKSSFGRARLVAEVDALSASFASSASAKRRKVSDLLQEDGVRRAYLRTLVVVLDHQLGMCGLSLAKFKLGAGAAVPRQGVVLTRRAGEERVVIDARAQTFIHRLVWHIHADQGPKSFGAFLYLQSTGLRLTISPDLIHRLLNDWHSGVRAAGLHTHRLEWKAVLSLRQGPWQQGAHHSLLRGCAAELESE